MELLLKGDGVDVNVVVKQQSPITLAFRSPNRRECAKLLLQHKNIRLAGFAFLHKAIRWNWDDIAETLIRNRQTNVNRKNSKLETPLYCAVKNGRRQIIQLLLADHKIDVNVENGRKGATALHCAVSLGFADAVKLLLEHKDIDVTKVSSYKNNNHEDNDFDLLTYYDPYAQSTYSANSFVMRTPLGLAFLTSKLDCAALLLEKVKPHSEFIAEKLIVSVGQNHDGCTRKLIEKGADVNMVVDNDGSILKHAVRKNSGAAVKVLLEMGASVNARSNPKQRTALHVAADLGFADVIKILLEFGANVNADDDDGNLPVHLSLRSKGCTQMLVNSSSPVNARNKLGSTPLHEAFKLIPTSREQIYENVASPDPISDEVFDDEVRQVRHWLVQNGSEINAVDSAGNSPLHVAVAHAGSSTEVKLLLDHGALVNVQNNSGETPLHLSCWKWNPEVTQILISSGAVVDVRNKNGETPLHLAAMRGRDIQILVDHGSDVNARDRFNQTPLHLAACAYREKNLELLLDLGADVNAESDDNDIPLHFAAHAKNAANIRILLSRGSKVKAQDRLGQTPLHIAAQHNHLSGALLLLQGPANVAGCQDAEQRQNVASGDSVLIGISAGVRSVDREGRTPLHFAAQSGNEQLIKTLIDFGAEIDAADSAMNSPLLAAVKMSNYKNAVMLAKHGANVNAADLFRRTALHHLPALIVKNAAQIEQDVYYSEAEMLGDMLLRAGGLELVCIALWCNLAVRWQIFRTISCH